MDASLVSKVVQGPEVNETVILVGKGWAYPEV